MKRHHGLLLSLLALLLSARALSQEPDIQVSPDRPDFANGIQIVPLGHLQVEGGATLLRSGGTTGVSAGELTVRIPLASRLETRVQLFGYVWTGEAQTSEGVVDPLVDVKWKLFDTDDTDFGLIGGTAVPAGARSQRAKHFQPYAAFSLDQALGEGLSVTVNLGGAYLTGGEGQFVQGYGGLTLALQLSKKFAVYGEAFGWSRQQVDGGGVGAVGAGIQILVTNRFMLDARIGTGLGPASPDLVLGAGASCLF
jgi:hypothetical protein